jgi:2-keto-4-pentenoate hydratase
MKVSADRTSAALAAALQRGMQGQLAEWRHKVQAHGNRLGWKIGFGDRASQQRMGLAAPVLGYLRRDRLLAPDGVFLTPVNAVIKAEVEVAIRIGRDVAAEVSAAEAEGAIAAYAPAVEVVDVTRPLDVSCCCVAWARAKSNSNFTASNDTGATVCRWPARRNKRATASARTFR